MPAGVLLELYFCGWLPASAPTRRVPALVPKSVPAIRAMTYVDVICIYCSPPEHQKGP